MPIFHEYRTIWAEGQMLWDSVGETRRGVGRPTGLSHWPDDDMTICQVNKPLWSDQNTFFVRNVMSLVIIITMIIIILIIITATWMLRHPKESLIPTPSGGVGVSYWGLDQSETCTSSEGSTNERAVSAPHKWARLLQQQWKPCLKRTETPVAMDTLEYWYCYKKN